MRVVAGCVLHVLPIEVLLVVPRHLVKLIKAMMKVMTSPSTWVRVTTRGGTAHFVTSWESILPVTLLPHTQTVRKAPQSKHVWLSG